MEEIFRYILAGIISLTIFCIIAKYIFELPKIIKQQNEHNLLLKKIAEKIGVSELEIKEMLKHPEKTNISEKSKECNDL